MMIIIVVLVVVQNRAIRRNNQTSTEQKQSTYKRPSEQYETNIDMHTYAHRTLEEDSFSIQKIKSTERIRKEQKMTGE